MGAGASKSRKVGVEIKQGVPAVKVAPTTMEAVKTASCAEVYSWLSWSPKPGTPCKNTLDKEFPGAMPGQAVLKRVSTTLKNKHGMTPENTIYGQSICPDEINNEKGDLADIMKEYWGEVFPMGGIGGAPYVGKTGFAAFSHHVPDDGHVFILFGPHVAVSKSGEVGKYARVGQSCESGACGAIMAAYSQCCAGNDMAFDMDDMQQAWLRQSMCVKIDEIKAAANPIAAATNVAYEVCRDKLLRVVNNNFGKGKLVLVGGIQINMPEPYDDHFQPKFFQVISHDGSAEDLLAELSFE